MRQPAPGSARDWSSSRDQLVADVSRYYEAKLRDYGTTHSGVDWNSRESQLLRFSRLLDVVESPSRRYSLVDFGCGYGELAHMLAERGDDVDYTGYDVSSDMIAAATPIAGARFTAVRDELVPADYCVASGLFNLRLAHDVETWEQYVWECIDELAALSTHGFSFNVLTGWSDPELLRDDLYYASPEGFLKECARRYGRHVALRHDYGLWEFTMTVRHG